MPMIGSAGYSSNTPLKQYHFSILADTHLHIVRGILSRAAWAFPSYLYIDLNAGPGQYVLDDGSYSLGSPLQMCLRADALGMPLTPYLCESDPTTAHTLRQTLVSHGLPTQGVTDGNNRVTVPHVLSNLTRSSGYALSTCYGLIYSDENGSLPPFDLLGKCAQSLRLCDILIHVAATPIKRQYYSDRHPLIERLDEMIAQVKKAHWYVRKPYGQHQWTFFLGTNWNAFPDFSKYGFFDTRSRAGANILKSLSYNHKERSGEQGDLFIS
jgi:hypothetical protein